MFKRILVIAASMFIFRNPVSLANATGMMITIGGIALYNRAKLAEKNKEGVKSENEEPLLPRFERSESAIFEV